MASRKAEERNEKIIRGLMKLPPNRRCINCNSLGPQYVCTNFWTFVCTTCSGIHREFTHRVKSVSMAKFTSQEVEELQNGGNQRARDIYLKEWDPQRQRLPNSSIVDKVREFIKNVYVDKKYAGGKTSHKPPIDAQSHEEEIRRASSYHSYSQSPPYDNQYEERRYGKQAHALTRKPGSDRGLYDGNMSRFAYSSSHLSDQMYEDRFANEGSVSRVSDYSTSSGGDPFRSGRESPNIQDTGFSPTFQTSRSTLGADPPHQTVHTFSEANAKRNADGIPRPQRSGSSGSFGSFDSNSMSHKSFNSGSFMDANSRPEQAAATHSDNVSNLDLFKAPVIPEAVSSINLFQLPETPAPFVDLFQASSISPVPSTNVYQPPQNNSPSSVDFFAQQQSADILVEKSQKLSVPKNEGWATFDIAQPTASVSSTESFTPANVPSNNESSFRMFDSISSLNTNIQWSPFPYSSAHGSLTSVSDLLFEDLYSGQAPTIATNTQSWNAFEDSTGNLPLEVIRQSSQPHLPAHIISSATDQYFGSTLPEDLNKNVLQRNDSHEFTGPNIPSHLMGPQYVSPVLPFVGDTQSHATDCKSSNPFDLPYDTELVENNMSLDMSSLQASLPNAQLPLPPTFLGDVSEPWLPQNPSTNFIPPTPPGTYMAAQGPRNVAAQGPVASPIGGVNPFV